MNAACNWLGTLTRENQEPAKSDLNQPQGSWKNWSSMPDCKCSWPWEWVLDLRKTCDSQNFLGILEVDLYMLGQMLSLQITLVQDKSLPLGNQNWRGGGGEAQIGDRIRCCRSQSFGFALGMWAAKQPDPILAVHAHACPPDPLYQLSSAYGSVALDTTWQNLPFDFAHHTHTI